ncbi:MAG: 5-(carboxyamino)imidazole ribonucleotide synthase [Amphritea sp.]|nr:5-(carboxyamino)imidazole ribonucleotide synthase [Amphritea sp.]
MRVAVFGAGQLARMMALAGWRLGVSFSYIALPGENVQCVDDLGDVVELTPELRGEALYEALGKPTVVTVEKEHVDLEVLRSLEPFCPVAPSPKAISFTQHRGREKTFLNDNGIPTAPFRLANSPESLRAGVAELGLPVLVKSCEEGYDGKGQWRLKEQADLDALMQDPAAHKELIIEGFINFDREVSLVAVRNAKGECAFYPLTENEHNNGILETSVAPATNSEALTEQAEDIAHKILDELGYVGVLAIELFVTGDKLLVNELAPRVHNSGHWTQSAGISSQFDNHIRAIVGLPLGETKPAVNVAMVNLLGHTVSRDLLNKGNVELHQYNKSLRPGRKVGHVNLWNIDRDALLQQMEEIVNAREEG